MIEKDIYNRRITELLKKKTLLIDMITQLLELARKPAPKQKEEPARLTPCESRGLQL
jgi:hypothetical protein